MAFFTNALTGAQIQQLYAAAGVPASIVIRAAREPERQLRPTRFDPASWRKAARTLAYQWYRSNGAAVAGQTTAALTFNPVGLANAGSYYVVVTNTYGRATSSVVALSVTRTAGRSTQQSPTDVRVFVGTTPTLRAVADGPQPISYQWTMDGSPIERGHGQQLRPQHRRHRRAHLFLLDHQQSTPRTRQRPSARSLVTVLTKPTAPYPVTVLNDHPMDYFRLDETPDNGSGNNGLPGLRLRRRPQCQLHRTRLSPSQAMIQCSRRKPIQQKRELIFGNVAAANSYAGDVSSFLNFATPDGSSAAFSIEAWVNGGIRPGPGAGMVALGYGNGGEQFDLDTGGPGANYRFFVRNAAGSACLANGTNAPNDGLWHHVVGVCDEANGRVYLYVDGQQTASGIIPTNSGILSWTISAEHRLAAVGPATGLRRAVHR